MFMKQTYTSNDHLWFKKKSKNHIMTHRHISVCSFTWTSHTCNFTKNQRGLIFQSYRVFKNKFLFYRHSTRIATFFNWSVFFSFLGILRKICRFYMHICLHLMQFICSLNHQNDFRISLNTSIYVYMYLFKPSHIRLIINWSVYIYQAYYLNVFFHFISFVFFHTPMHRYNSILLYSIQKLITCNLDIGIAWSPIPLCIYRIIK